MPDPKVNLCPLCGGAAAPFHRAEGRDFLRCGGCRLTFVPKAQHLSADAERARYAEHNNSPEDAGYRAFLDRLLVPLAAALPAGAEGLDFGSGPGPTASVMMRERGFPCEHWDPYFAPDEGRLGRKYGFVTCTEVLEHLREPGATLARLDGLLAPGGILGVLTGVLEDDSAFPGWWYKKDPTHIAFYRPETLTWIAARFGWKLTRPSKDAALFENPRQRTRLSTVLTTADIDTSSGAGIPALLMRPADGDAESEHGEHAERDGEKAPLAPAGELPRERDDARGRRREQHGESQAHEGAGLERRRAGQQAGQREHPVGQGLAAQQREGGAERHEGERGGDARAEHARDEPRGGVRLDLNEGPAHRSLIPAAESDIWTASAQSTAARTRESVAPRTRGASREPANAPAATPSATGTATAGETSPRE